MTYRVMVLGGYGHFGARIVRALAAAPQVHVIAAGVTRRDRRHLARCCAWAHLSMPPGHGR